VVIGHVFGYGSLVTFAGAQPATLSGHRRVWGVAMDNRVAIPGYKVYVLPDGTRPAASIAFLDLVAAEDGTEVNGLLLPVDADRLAALDARERQYERTDVTHAISPAPDDGLPVWTYTGRPPGRARIRDAPPVLIQRAYADLVASTFAAFGPTALTAYRASTDAPPFPLTDLTRIDLPER
jgi:hypothetical protein